MRNSGALSISHSVMINMNLKNNEQPTITKMTNNIATRTECCSGSAARIKMHIFQKSMKVMTRNLNTWYPKIRTSTEHVSINLKIQNLERPIGTSSIKNSKDTR
jgi:hypothetical protein